MWISLTRACFISVLLLGICGAVYPISLSALGYLFFPKQTTGSFLYSTQSLPAGSELLGQRFSSARYFHPRPGLVGADSMSKETGFSLSSPNLSQALQVRKKELFQSYPNMPREEVPGDWMTRSASAFDPHLSMEAALAQVERVARERNLTEEVVRKCIDQEKISREIYTTHSTRYDLNVLKLNLSLDAL